MEMRVLGTTGVKVSPLCLGAMMFGAWGNPDHDESVRIIHRALDAGINFIDTADVYSARRVRGDRRQGAGRRPARTVIVLATKAHGADGRGPERAGQLAPLDHPRVREQPAPARHRLHRPLPDPPAGPGDRHRRDAGRAHRPDQGRQDPLRRQLDVPGVADRRGAVGRGAARPGAVRLRAAAVLDPGPRHRGRGAADLPALRHGRHPVEPARRRLAVGPLPQGRASCPGQPAGRADPAALRHEPARQPGASSTPPSSWPCWPRRPACP